jgi:hypothetical protein
VEETKTLMDTMASYLRMNDLVVRLTCSALPLGWDLPARGRPECR